MGTGLFWIELGFGLIPSSFVDARVGPVRIRPFEFGGPEPVICGFVPGWPVCEENQVDMAW